MHEYSHMHALTHIFCTHTYIIHIIYIAFYVLHIHFGTHIYIHIYIYFHLAIYPNIHILYLHQSIHSKYPIYTYITCMHKSNLLTHMQNIIPYKFSPIYPQSMSTYIFSSLCLCTYKNTVSI